MPVCLSGSIFLILNVLEDAFRNIQGKTVLRAVNAESKCAADSFRCRIDAVDVHAAAGFGGVVTGIGSKCRGIGGGAVYPGSSMQRGIG